MTLGLIQTSPCAAEFNTMDISKPIANVNLSQTKKPSRTLTALLCWNKQLHVWLHTKPQL